MTDDATLAAIIHPFPTCVLRVVVRLSPDDIDARHAFLLSLASSPTALK